MNEDQLRKNLSDFKQALWFVCGISFSLLILAAAGDVNQAGWFELPAGWFALWIGTTVASIPLGLILIIGKRWRSLPIQERRLTATGYLLVGLSNLIALSFIVTYAYPGFPIYVCPTLYATSILPFVARAHQQDFKEDELFP